MSGILNKTRTRTAPRNSSPKKDPKFSLIKQRISQIALSMKSPLTTSACSMRSDRSNKENPKKEELKLTPTQKEELEVFK